MADQCEHTGKRGQCSAPKVEGSNYCLTHSDEADRIRGYRLSSPELRERFEHHSRSDLFKSLRQEIDLLHAMVEEQLADCKTPAERINAFNKVRPAIVEIVKCTETISKLERQNNIVLGKEALAWLNKEIISILIGELSPIPNYETIIDRVASKLADALANARNQE